MRPCWYQTARVSLIDELNMDWNHFSIFNYVLKFPKIVWHLGMLSLPYVPTVRAKFVIIQKAHNMWVIYGVQLHTIQECCLTFCTVCFFCFTTDIDPLIIRWHVHGDIGGMFCFMQRTLTIYVLRVVHAPGMPATFSPPPTSKETAS